ncbi:MAG: hypothetical protein N3G75_09260 [Methanothrix sp.]|nr:hypothetical protein [Methanothrix sp.]MCX8207995.1 hypothetical protein [Methanothrix sp.]
MIEQLDSLAARKIRDGEVPDAHRYLTVLVRRPDLIRDVLRELVRRPGRTYIEDAIRQVMRDRSAHALVSRGAAR